MTSRRQGVSGSCAPLALVAGLALASPALAQLRVATWNISLYGGPNATRDPAFQTVLFSTFQGRSLNPDVIALQEVNAQGGLTSFLNLMNAATAPGTFAAAPWVAGPDSTSVFIYRTAKVQFLGTQIVSAGGNSPSPPRNTLRYLFRPVGYGSTASTVALYSCHMKAGTSSDDANRRGLEASRIRTDIGTLLGQGYNAFIVLGDLNVQTSTDQGFATLVSAGANPLSRLIDPIRTPGAGASSNTWYQQSSMRFVHTQAPGGNPTTTGGMDDRFDFILLSPSIVDGVAGQGFEYVGNANIPYSTTTWNDPNHSYRAWGNDGSFLNNSITSTASTNAMVGQAIANAIAAAASTDTFGGHAPVFLDLRVPPRATATATIDFGTVPLNGAAIQTLGVTNGASTTLWNTAGIATLSYSLAPTAGFTAPAGTFTAPAASGNLHDVAMDTSTPGPKSGTITIASNSPEEPTLVVTLTGLVEAPPPACYPNCDGSSDLPILNALDFSCFLSRYVVAQSLPPAQQATDYANCDGSTSAPALNALDFSCFLTRYREGCR